MCEALVVESLDESELSLDVGMKLHLRSQRRWGRLGAQVEEILLSGDFVRIDSLLP